MTNDNFSFRVCSSENIDDLLDIQEEAFSILDNPDLLRRNSREMLLECLCAPHYTLGAFHSDIMAGFGILYHGGGTDENLSLLMENSAPEPDKCANIKLIIVREAFRGHGLQRQITEFLESKAKERGYKMLCATVSPENLHSLKNFERMGYTVYGEYKKYGGLSRLLLYKYI